MPWTSGLARTCKTPQNNRSIMLIIPAIDLKDGHCVRLKQGDMNDATVFSDGVLHSDINPRIEQTPKRGNPLRIGCEKGCAIVGALRLDQYGFRTAIAHPRNRRLVAHALGEKQDTAGPAIEPVHQGEIAAVWVVLAKMNDHAGSLDPMSGMNNQAGRLVNGEKIAVLEENGDLQPRQSLQILVDRRKPDHHPIARLEAGRGLGLGQALEPDTLANGPLNLATAQARNPVLEEPVQAQALVGRADGVDGAPSVEANRRLELRP